MLGSEEGVKAAIDTSEGGKQLSEDESYTNALDDAAEDRLGFFYMNSPELLRPLRESGAPMPDSFQEFFEEPLVATLDADEDGVVFEGSVPAQVGAGAALFGEASDLVEQLPADSWLGIAQADFGRLIDFYVDAFAGVVGGRDAIEAAAQGVHRTRPPARRDRLDGRLWRVRARHEVPEWTAP